MHTKRATPDTSKLKNKTKWKRNRNRLIVKKRLNSQKVRKKRTRIKSSEEDIKQTIN